MNRSLHASSRTFESASTGFSPGDTRVVDRDLALRKIADIDQSFQQLAEYQGIDLDSYRSDWKIQRIVERTLHLMIEACMDLADHIVADRKLRVPDTGGATFEILAEAGLIDSDLSKALARMVGFRNILVHDYARLEPAIVLRVLKTDTGDIRRFRDAILAIL
jgi:uncharacterized protein YutE (UPF0331/DUF86 family)